MRWQQLFADLSAQFQRAEEGVEWAESASRARSEVAAVRLADRLFGARGSRVTLRCRGAGQVAGTLVDGGADWLLLEDDGAAELLVGIGAVVSAAGVGRVTAAPEGEGSVRARLGLAWALRALARERRPVHVVLVDGARLTGTLDRVGADFCELAEHPADAARRPSAVRGVHAVALSGIAVVRTALPRLD